MTFPVDRADVDGDPQTFVCAALREGEAWLRGRLGPVRSMAEGGTTLWP